MKLFSIRKDGGPESHVWGYFLIEIKGLFSVVLLHFHPGSRDVFHTHAFNATSWVLKGKLLEIEVMGDNRFYRPSLKPIYTPRKMFHKVFSYGHTWAISFRGPWNKTWKEHLPNGKTLTLTNGRNVVNG